jgi:signal transduction histidine kinase
VNHDIKNGLVPIRNVLRHLNDVAGERPETLAVVFNERSATLDSGVEYLEALAANYARLSPQLDGGSTQLQPVIEEVVRGMRGTVSLSVDVEHNLPSVRGDAVVIRRILENLVSNAIDATVDRDVSQGVEISAKCDGGGVELAVRDAGAGMRSDELDRAFEDFYTTKPDGTGLGLSIVRRLVLDLEGSLKVETEPGQGTCVAVVLPAVTSRLA